MQAVNSIIQVEGGTALLDMFQDLAGYLPGSIRELAPWRGGPPVSREDILKRFARDTSRDLLLYDIDWVIADECGIVRALVSIKSGEEESRPTELYIMAQIAEALGIPALEIRWDGEDPATSSYRIYRRA